MNASTGMTRKASAAAAAFTALAVVLAACGGSDAKGDPDSTATAAAQASATPAAKANPRGPKLKVVSSDFGRILADGKGRALYLFTSDRLTSNCYGDCATAWPPYLVKSPPAAVGSVNGAKIGTTRRNDGGLQVTYAGHPLYHYVGDRSPGEVNCQAAAEFGGLWYVVRSSGKAVR